MTPKLRWAERRTEHKLQQLATHKILFSLQCYHFAFDWPLGEGCGLVDPQGGRYSVSWTHQRQVPVTRIAWLNLPNQARLQALFGVSDI